jgi:hypothetical protein
MALGLAQISGSAWLASLSARGDTVPGVNYTVIASKDDEVAYPLGLSDHLGLAHDPVALADVLNALDPTQPVQVPCLTVLPFTSSVGPDLAL